MSTFKVPNDELHRSRPAVSVESFDGLRVLAVDDSATTRRYLRNILRPYGVVVAEANSGEAALDVLRNGEGFDLILLDLVMKGMSGIEVLKCLREVDGETTVVVLTGKADIKSSAAAFREGADGFIEKQHLPYLDSHDDLLYALEQAQERRQGIIARQQLDRIKADFYSMITHDLRNPTCAIMLAATSLAQESTGPLNDKQRLFLEMIRNSSDSLYTRVNDYLDFAQMDAGALRLNVTGFDLNDVLDEEVGLSRLQAQTRKQTITLELPPEPVAVRADRERLKQVLENLISNASKYAPDGGGIHVTLTGDEDEVVITVRDSGQGMDSATLDELFTKYHRAPGKLARAVKGTGLGLVIVKQIVEAHGGTVTATSDGRPGKGATFTVRLPAAHPATD